MLPASLKAELREHLKAVKRQHEEDLRAGYSRVYRPHALSRKYPTRRQRTERHAMARDPFR
jgi:hypothetical protein